ncbi:MAG: hypothetical protein M5U18_08290 [Dehalococcoidia bacterium]|nr:hypothetical protein [Dehalococcoidia bacterium]
MADTGATFRADPVNAEREIRVEMRPLELHEQVEEYYARVRRLGTDPWRADSHVEWSLGLERMATMIVPVPILRTDLKADVEERATRIISELWKRLGLKTPRSRGTSTTRARNWDAYLDWLWQHRVQRRPISEIRSRLKLARGRRSFAEHDPGGHYSGAGVPPVTRRLSPLKRRYGRWQRSPTVVPMVPRTNQPLSTAAKCIVASSRLEQGLPPQVESDVVIARLAVLVVAAVRSGGRA